MTTSPIELPVTWVDCPECDGTGIAEYLVGVPDYVHGGEQEWRECECENCGGNGTIEFDPELDELEDE